MSIPRLTQRNATQRNEARRSRNGFSPQLTGLVLACLLCPFSALAQTQASSCVFGVWGVNEVNIRDRATVALGIVGSQNNVSMGVAAEVNGDIVSGGAVFMANNAVASSNVYYNLHLFKQEPVYILGTESQIAELLPVDLSPRSIQYGNTDIMLNNGDSITLPPGDYRNLQMNAGATLVLEGGIYNFSRFIMEGGPASVVLDAKESFIEVNAQNEMRFGDRNSFILEGGTKPEDVQFYTNSQGQIKIGTDTSFKGVVTAPLGQIYLFPRSVVEGNLLARSVWIDNEATVYPVQNCTAYNTEIDDTDIINACNALGFEDLRWTNNSIGSGVTIALSDLYTSNGETALEATLSGETEAILEATDDMTMIFSEDAATVTVEMDVYSNATPFSTWGAEIDVYLKEAGAAAYTLAGTMAYDADANSEEMTTYSIALSNALSEMVMNNPINVKLRISTQQQNGVFWMDDLRFCDDLGDCNIACPPLTPPTYTAPDLDEKLFETVVTGEDSAIVENVTSIDGIVRSIDDSTVICDIEAVFHGPMNKTEKLSLGQYTFALGTEIPFAISAADLPFNTPGMITDMGITVIEYRTAPDGSTYTQKNFTGGRYYKHNSDGTITHFNNEEFIDTFDGYMFKSPNPYAGIPLVDSNGNVNGRILNVQIIVDEEFDLSSIDTETDPDTDTAIIIVE
ncbi:MAG: hypothetical protein JXR76_22475 [Deltaproteobacteria bacterium]|nr:hypothetical protein [Deltaproteobacteria bacterium]